MLLQLGWQMSCIHTALSVAIALAHLDFQQITLGSVSLPWRPGGRKVLLVKGQGRASDDLNGLELSLGSFIKAQRTFVKLLCRWGLTICGMLPL